LSGHVTNPVNSCLIVFGCVTTDLSYYYWLVYIRDRSHIMSASEGEVFSNADTCWQGREGEVKAMLTSAIFYYLIFTTDCSKNLCLYLVFGVLWGSASYAGLSNADTSWQGGGGQK